MDNVLELENRRKIYTRLKENPGLHLINIAKTLHPRVSIVGPGWADWSGSAFPGS